MTTKVELTLSFQHNIRNYQTIPKQYLPFSFLSIPGDNTSLTDDFKQKYHHLFFEHLNQVITCNTIAQELEEARLRSIISHTEQYLATINTPPTTIAHLHQKFLAENKIAHHIIHPDLQRVLISAPEPTPTPPHEQLAEPISHAHAPIPPSLPIKRRKDKEKQEKAPPRKKKKPTYPPPAPMPPWSHPHHHFLSQCPSNKHPT